MGGGRNSEQAIFVKFLHTFKNQNYTASDVNELNFF